MNTEMANNNVVNKHHWVRAEDGVIGGVCLGFARQFGVDVSMIRIGWVLTVLFLGTGILAYILCVLAFPRTDRLDKAMNKKILGVCVRLAQKGNIEVGLVRLLALIALGFTCGGALIAYLVLHVVLPWEPVQTPTRTRSII